MDLSGSHVLEAPVETIWKMILDPETLARITPGISQLELESEDNYKAIAEVKIGPVKGRFEGTAQIVDKSEHESLTLKVQQNSKIGNVAADVFMKMEPAEEGKTRLSFDGKANVSGLLARTGGRVMTGVANTLTKQFFDNFEAELKRD
ncbi:carbon monoxide dehydrogenase subunit G [Marinilongibacter aquaticus]|uniref:CoxG family protein n=1 Tax=Marinilongibacter aquaticus TaxID=2975157 RepID=UPI0021BD0B5B|nr:carbon monoxide dehydrogenase subunit G [Marinilongibacter aquaticus]UBM57426.1 carbon monoxide dehydrogenase subunit G [Marinilongibacter aquaticus]